MYMFLWIMYVQQVNS